MFPGDLCEYSLTPFVLIHLNPQTEKTRDEPGGSDCQNASLLT